MINYQIGMSVFLTIEYCSFHKSENKKNMTSCRFASKLSKSVIYEFR
jgi:hypothetical protein